MDGPIVELVMSCHFPRRDDKKWNCSRTRVGLLQADGHYLSQNLLVKSPHCVALEGAAVKSTPGDE